MHSKSSFSVVVRIVGGKFCAEGRNTDPVPAGVHSETSFMVIEPNSGLRAAVLVVLNVDSMMCVHLSRVRCALA
jgi:hypothetical protein